MLTSPASLLVLVLKTDLTMQDRLGSDRIGYLVIRAFSMPRRWYIYRSKPPVIPWKFLGPSPAIAGCYTALNRALEVPEMQRSCNGIRTDNEVVRKNTNITMTTTLCIINSSRLLGYCSHVDQSHRSAQWYMSPYRAPTLGPVSTDMGGGEFESSILNEKENVLL